jgi:5-(aminomethyl)-3-furanmethanol phosphate kinase
MNFEAVLKVGGSLSRGPNLAALCQEIGRQGQRHYLLIVPGGGDFADTVREHYRRYHLTETAAHVMALLAMDQYGWLLGDLIPNGDVVRDILSARRTAANGRVPILLPSALLIQADPLPNSWQVTSDSIAAWIAGVGGASRLVLLKDVDGLLFDRPRSDTAEVLPALNVKELMNQPGGVDEYLAVLLASLDLETWVINGQLAERLAELLDTGQTLGTRISRE